MRPDDLFAVSTAAQDLAQAAQGDPVATTRVGYRYITGSGGAVDSGKARRYFQAASSSNPIATAWVQYIDFRSCRSTQITRAAAFQALQAAANATEPVAQTLLGTVYFWGLRNTVRDVPRAKSLYSAASSHFALAKTR